MDRFMSIIGALALCACSPQSAKPQERAEKPVEGWGPFRLGMDYDAALAAMPEARWNPSALEDCQNDLALKGCILSQYQGILITVDGIGFSPSLVFDKHGKLIEISLDYRHEGRVGRNDCLDVYGRSLDFVAKEYGPLAFPNAKAEPGWVTEQRRTGGGVIYSVGSKMGAQTFVTQPIRGEIGGVQFPTALPITKWNTRPYVSAIAFLITVDGKNICQLSVTYSQPE